MKKEWFAAKELVDLGGLPGTAQGVNQRAKRENWVRRRRQGVQGKAVEYHIDSIPTGVQHVLRTMEDSVLYSPHADEPFTIWVTAYSQLTSLERDKIVALLMRRGIAGLMEKVNLPDSTELAESEMLSDA
ncbi:Mu DNA-binding domain [Leminorella richardii]|uniref:Mu DNA-binding domain n=1 Tax=Leminorella richardii TaxID=158841 RepID=A0A2X4UXB6_9GAMM|nr:DNA-binding protein [Leminorella richardii]SQI43451.1 Mu DNA-binding domain [Leminorella richardii]